MPAKAVFDLALAARLHANGMTLCRVSKVPGMPSQTALKRHLLAGGHEVWTGPWKLRAVSADTLAELHHTRGLTAEQIGEMFDCSASAVRRKAAKLGLSKGRGCGSTKHPPGPSHPNWRGGKHTSPSGYVFVRRPDNPMAGANGYVAEHRLVMSEKIGRPLASKEQVHHVNGIKDDNRPENLIVVKSGKHQQLHADHKREVWGLRKRIEILESQLNPAPELKVMG